MRLDDVEGFSSPQQLLSRFLLPTCGTLVCFELFNGQRWLLHCLSELRVSGLGRTEELRSWLLVPKFTLPADSRVHEILEHRRRTNINYYLQLVRAFNAMVLLLQVCLGWWFGDTNSLLLLVNLGFQLLACVFTKATAMGHGADSSLICMTVWYLVEILFLDTSPFTDKWLELCAFRFVFGAVWLNEKLMVAVSSSLSMAMCLRIVQASGEGTFGDTSRMIVKELFLSALSCLSCYGLRIFSLHVIYASELNHRATQACRGMLASFCDCVVQLDSNLQLQGPLDKLAGVLGSSNPALLQGQPLEQLLAEEADKQRFQELIAMALKQRCDDSQKQGPERTAALIRLNLSHMGGKAVPVQLFHICFADVEDHVTHMLGICEEGTATRELPGAAEEASFLPDARAPGDVDALHGALDAQALTSSAFARIASPAEMTWGLGEGASADGSLLDVAECAQEHEVYSSRGGQQVQQDSATGRPGEHQADGASRHAPRSGARKASAASASVVSYAPSQFSILEACSVDGEHFAEGCMKCLLRQRASDRRTRRDIWRCPRCLASASNWGTEVPMSSDKASEYSVSAPSLGSEVLEAAEPMEVERLLRLEEDPERRCDLLEEWVPELFEHCELRLIALDHKFDLDGMQRLGHEVQMARAKEAITERLLLGKRLPLPRSFWARVVALEQDCEHPVAHGNKLIWLLKVPAAMAGHLEFDRRMYRALKQHLPFWKRLATARLSSFAPHPDTIGVHKKPPETSCQRL